MQLRYHKDIWIPKHLNRKFASFNPKWTEHAKLQCDRYKGRRVGSVIPMITEFNPDKYELIEVIAYSDSSRFKHLYRTIIGSHYICYVISNDGSIVTCWTNKVGDEHATLNKSIYRRRGQKC